MESWLVVSEEDRLNVRLCNLLRVQVFGESSVKWSLIRSSCTGRCDGKRFVLEGNVVNGWQIISKCFGAAQPFSKIGRRRLHKHLFGQNVAAHLEAQDKCPPKILLTARKKSCNRKMVTGRTSTVDWLDLVAAAQGMFLKWDWKNGLCIADPLPYELTCVRWPTVLTCISVYYWEKSTVDFHTGHEQPSPGWKSCTRPVPDLLLCCCYNCYGQ